MTDKEQIMIDGVDVSKCEGIDLSLSPLVKCKYLKFKTSDGGIAGIWCSDHTNCCFKQLARKTQECEELKRYLKWIGISLGLNIDANFIGENAIEHWAVVHLSIENAIQDLKNKM